MYSWLIQDADVPGGFGNWIVPSVSCYDCSTASGYPVNRSLGWVISTRCEESHYVSYVDDSSLSIKCPWLVICVPSIWLILSVLIVHLVWSIVLQKYCQWCIGCISDLGSLQCLASYSFSLFFLQKNVELSIYMWNKW